ncbi:hypothetical protein DYU05_05775 [Mucilaginibacter terrenus]|uniref:Signal transduction histidine kinase internal region domain-containing protein n=1 Tax=Mucilaginibacter terrenus TaxID=2482727 RepID=A0A3E2NW80_9SPHI|nr:histidine kinase [Mucilaginibacter terrenus]RFZ85110.1 hypothetical protein DYU05_05775 [Mucilaginibacter terrenus]
MMKRCLSLLTKWYGRIPWLTCLCWMLFVSYELLFVYLTRQPFGSTVTYLIYYSINISLFYCHLWVLNTTFRSDKPRILKGLVLLTLQFTGFLLIKAIPDLLFTEPGLTFSEKLQMAGRYATSNIVRNIYFMVFATFYWVAGRAARYRQKAASAERMEIQAQKESAELQVRLTRARNLYLQQQMNPHMLFNALNFVYNKVHASSPEAADCLACLSDLVRFTLDAADAEGTASLAGEAAQLDNLLRINNYRFEGKLCISMEVSGELYRFRILPLVLLTLTENVFKHGDLTCTERPAHLLLTVTTEGMLHYRSSNKKKAATVHLRERRSGLDNTRERLKLFYKNDFTLTTQDTEDQFDLDLTINLQRWNTPA